jgi:hypothetical protein
MYGSYYLVSITARSINYAVLNKLPHRGLLIVKVASETFFKVEDFGKWLSEKLNDERDLDWTLEGIEKKYAYSAAEMDMFGKIDFDLTDNTHRPEQFRDTQVNEQRLTSLIGEFTGLKNKIPS